MTTAASFLDSLKNHRAEPPRVAAPAWLKAIQEDAWQKAVTAGLPTTRHESYRYTSLRPLAGLTATFAPESPWEFLSDEAGNRLRELLDPAGLNLVFVDGTFVHELSGAGPEVDLNGQKNWSLYDAVHVEDLSEALRGPSAEVVQSILQDIAAARSKLPVPLAHVAPQETTLEHLGSAFMNDGVVIHISEDCVVPVPIRLVHAQSGRATVGFTRHLILGGPASSSRISETYLSLGHLNNTKVTPALPDDTTPRACFSETSVIMSPNSTLRHDRVLASGATLHFGSTNVTLAAGAKYHALALNLNSRIGRHDITAMIEGEGADVILDGLTTGQDEQVLDTHSVIDHRVPNTTSRQVYKSILKDKSRVVFSGKIFVRRGAQKTVAHQQSKSLLLSSDAEIDAKPQLEIEADDVRCAHGATVAQLNQDEMFYLRSRGIPHAKAEAMLCDAFAAEIWQSAEDPWLESLTKNELAGFFK